jgi:asparagine N-glycosylation enzyme membrane subunit Stt3
MISQTPVFAEAAITWTPQTFYMAATILHIIVYLLGFKLLQTDPEHNTFVGAVIAAVIANFATYALSDYGLFGIMGSGAVHFIVLVAVTSGEALKSLMVFLVAMAAYAGLGTIITERTPLTTEQIGGIPKVIMTGGIEAEPITEDQADEMSAPAGKKK